MSSAPPGPWARAVAQNGVVRGLWEELADMAEDQLRWVVVVVPVAVFTVWSVEESASRLHVPPMVRDVAVVSSLSPAWQLGLLLGGIAMLCTTVWYLTLESDAGALAFLALGGQGVVLLVGVMMGIVAADQGGDVTWLTLAVWGEFWSNVLTMWVLLSLSM